MDLIPIISKFILFILFALIIVLAVSYFLLRTIKKKDEENESSLRENRKHIRTYIINQRKFVETSAGVKSLHLNKSTYHGLSIQKNKTSNRKTNHDQANASHSKGINEKRYVIVNKSKTTTPKSYTGSGFHQAEYSPFKTLHHKDD